MLKFKKGKKKKKKKRKEKRKQTKNGQNSSAFISLALKHFSFHYFNLMFFFSFLFNFLPDFIFPISRKKSALTVFRGFRKEKKNLTRIHTYLRNVCHRKIKLGHHMKSFDNNPMMSSNTGAFIVKKDGALI